MRFKGILNNRLLKTITCMAFKSVVEALNIKDQAVAKTIVNKKEKI